MNSLPRTKRTCPASKVFSTPEERRNKEQEEEKNGLQERSMTGLEMVSTNKIDIVTMASDRGELVCDFYSFQVR